MHPFRLPSIAALVLTSIATPGLASVTIDYTERGVVLEGIESDHNYATGTWDSSINVDPLNTLEFYRAAQSSNIDASGHFSGTASSEYPVSQLGAPSFSRSYYWVDFSINVAYNYALSAALDTMYSDGISSIALYDLMNDVCLELILGPLPTATLFDGTLNAGQYRFFVESRVEIASNSPSRVDFDFQLTPVESNVVPEPASIAVWSCLCAGAVGMAVMRRRKVTE